MPERARLQPVAEVAGRSSLVAVLALISHETSHRHSAVRRARLLGVEEAVVVEIAAVAVDVVGSLGEDGLDRSLMKINASVCFELSRARGYLYINYTKSVIPFCI